MKVDSILVVNEKYVIGQEHIVPVNLEMIKEVGLMACIVHTLLMNSRSSYRANPVPIVRYDSLLTPYAETSSKGVMESLRILHRAGYIKYLKSNSKSNVAPRARVIKTVDHDYDVDLRWIMTGRAFSPIKLMILSTLDALGETTTKEIHDNTDIPVTSISAILVKLRRQGLVNSKPIRKDKNFWEIAWDKITVAEGLEMSSNISKLLELKEIYSRKAEKALDAVKFYEEQITKEVQKNREESICQS